MKKMEWPTAIQQMERTRMPCKHVMDSGTSSTPSSLSVLLGNEKAIRARETAHPETKQSKAKRTLINIPFQASCYLTEV